MSTRPKRQAAPRRWLGQSSLAGVLGTARLALSACGSAGSVTILDTETVEQAIEHNSLAQQGERARVSCPSEVPQKKGLAIACTVVSKRGSTQFAGTRLDESGRVRYEVR